MSLNRLNRNLGICKVRPNETHQPLLLCFISILQLCPDFLHHIARAIIQKAEILEGHAKNILTGVVEQEADVDDLRWVKPVTPHAILEGTILRFEVNFAEFSHCHLQLTA